MQFGTTSNPYSCLVLAERTRMTLFLHGLGIGLTACGALGLLAYAISLAWQEFKKLGT